MPDVDRTNLLIGLVGDAAASAGLGMGTYEVIRIGTNLVMCERRNGIVARVSPANSDLTLLNQWMDSILRIAATGAPILAPLTDRAIQIGARQYVTFWPLGETMSHLEDNDFATLLSRFHSTEIHQDDRPWTYVERCELRLTLIGQSTMEQSLKTHLHGLASDELLSFDTLSYFNPALVHGDAHPSNVVRYQKEMVLIDLDNVGFGPIEIDLAPYAVSCRRFPHAKKSWDNFLGAYPFKVDTDLLASLCRIREITMILWLASLWDKRREVREELLHRIKTLNTSDQWKAL